MVTPTEESLVLQAWGLSAGPTTLPQKTTNVTNRMTSETGLLSRKRSRRWIKDMKFGTWNVLTLLKAGAMNSLAEELEKYKMDIVALQEIRWKGKGEIHKNKFSFYYSGHQTRQGEKGVGFMVSKRLSKSIISFTPISERICVMRIKGKLHNITFINVYAPTENAEEGEVDNFYEQLQEVCDRVPKYDAAITLGDFNAKLGEEDAFTNIFGKHSLHSETNNNGLRVGQFASANNYVVVSTRFPRKNIYKGTWKIPGTNEVNQIDHILISKRWATDINNVRTFRGANSDSDHYLVGAWLRQKIAMVAKGKNEQHRKWNVDLFKNPTKKEEYQTTLHTKLRECTESNDIEEEWKQLKGIIIETAKETIGETRKQRNAEWYDDECRQATEEKRQARLKLLQRNTRNNRETYNEKRIQAARTCRKKKREAMRRKVEEILEHNNQKESRKFYKSIKESTQAFRPKLTACKDKQGNLLTEKDKIISRWREYFKENLCIENEEIETMHCFTAEPDIENPSYEEVEQVIIKLNNHKAPGTDEITAELLKNGGPELWERIHNLIILIWTQEQMPKEWATGIIQPIYKKGDKMQCENYRPITLLNIVYKVLSGVIYNRLLDYSEDIIGDYQCGFRPNRSTTDNIFMLRQIQEKAYEYDIDLYNIYIDFKQAFDSVKRTQLLSDIRILGIPGKYIRLIQMTLMGSQAAIRVDGQLTPPFDINVGVRQGDALSTMLFNLALEASFQRINTKGHIGIRSSQISAYADDVVIVSRDKAHLCETLTTIDQEAQKRGLRINENKTKYMEVTRRPTKYHNNIKIENYTFERVEAFTYLGVETNHNNSVSSEIKSRIISGNRCYYANKKLMASKLLDRNTKTKIYRTLIRPVVTYGCESWTMTKRDEELLRIFERKILRKVYGPIHNADGTWRIRTNNELSQLNEGADIVKYIKSQRLRWLGHVSRMDDTRTTRKVMQWKPSGRRKRGRPRMRWLDDAEDDLKAMNIRCWRRKTQERAEWKEIVGKAKTHPGL